jgi:uncharacterized membrane protein
MGIDVTSSIVINRPRTEVAAFLEDPANDPRWIRALSSVEPLTPPPYGKGTRVRRVAKMAGRTIDYTTEITAYLPGQRNEMDTIKGLPMHVTYEIADDGDGRTRVSVRNEGGSGFLFSLAGPLIGRMVKSRVDGDLRELKRILERDGTAPTASSGR